jgi:hypothetical protein
MKLPKPEYRVLDGKTGCPLRIVADGAISSQGTCGGRLIPLVIVDTSARPDIDDFIRVHGLLVTPGDVHAQWGQIEHKESTVVLWLKFIRPVEISFAVEFNVVGQAILVEQALSNKGLYIQGGRDGDRLTNDINRPKVFMEIVDTGYQKYWEHTFLQAYAKSFRTKGLNRSQSRQAAHDMLKNFRELNGFRMPDK